MTLGQVVRSGAGAAGPNPRGGTEPPGRRRRFPVAAAELGERGAAPRERRGEERSGAEGVGAAARGWAPEVGACGSAALRPSAGPAASRVPARLLPVSKLIAVSNFRVSCL